MGFNSGFKGLRPQKHRVTGGRIKHRVTGGRIKLQKEEIQDLYSSVNIIRMIVAKTMRWAGHVARVYSLV